MQLPLRVAILETDTLSNKARIKYAGDGYGSVFKLLLESGAKALGRPNPETGISISSYNVINNLSNYPNLDHIDAILITGSQFDAHADIPWINRLVEFTAQVLAQNRVKILAICFGHQIVGRAMGAKVGRSNAWEVAVHDVDLSDRGKQLFNQDKLAIQHVHQDMVFHCPEGVKNIGTSPVCTVQGMYKAGRLFTMQGHPEFDEEFVCEILDELFEEGVFDNAFYQKALKQAALPHDGLVVAKAFVKFLLDDDST